MKPGHKACHVMHSQYLVKINEGATSAKRPFLDVGRSESVPSLALKRHFLLQTAAPEPVCSPAPTYHVRSWSEHIPTVQVASMSSQTLLLPG